MQKDLAKDWAIIGSGITEYDVNMRERLQVQDFLTTLIELDPEGNQSCEIVGPMIGYVPVEKNNHKLINTMSDEKIKIVSLTVTEGGYFLDENGGFDIKHPDILNDINNPDAPKTVFGVIVSALRNRKKNDVGPFTGLSCDNLIQNGNKLKQAVIGIAREQDLELSEWINKNCTFPNAMVDCIVPRTGEVEINIVKNLGIEDHVPVSHEDFRQWVIEDKFCRGRPPWEKVGVQFSDNVHGYEDQKIRILNGGHQILANVAELLNIETSAIPGSGKVIKTGSLGDVMQESIQAALTVVRNRAQSLGIYRDFYNEKDLHIHVPEGATPKDGPSAGIGMCTSIVSVLTGIPVRSDTAMTGEITLHGQVLKIGGLKEKLLAAHRGGIKNVIIPQENAGDLKEVPKNITQDLNIKPVSWIDEVLQIALESKTKPLSEADFMGENAKKSHSGGDNRPSTH